MNFDIDNYVNNIKIKLHNWEIKLLSELSKYSNTNKNLYLINSDFLEQFFSRQKISKNEFMQFNNELNIKMKNFMNIFEDPINTIDNFPNVLVLNDECFSFFKNNNHQESISPINGNFYNKILILNITNNIYIIFFNDNRSQLRQGYLKIIDNNSHIINDLKKNGVCIIFKNINNNSIIYKSKEYEINILSYKNRPYTHKTDYNEKRKFNNNNNNNIINNNKKICFNMNNLNSLNPIQKILRKTSNHQRTSSSNMEERRFNKQKINISLSLEELLPSKAIHKQSTPGIIGLINIGATCYMNATIQCLSNVKNLRNELLNKDLYKDLEKNKNTNKKLSFALAEVLKNLWENINKRFYSPDHFKEVISEMNPLFKGIAANDSKDLILFLLENIHKELNNPQNINIDINNNVNSHNLNEVFNEFVKDYNSKNRSIISNEFYGFFNSQSVCGYCNNIVHNVQTYNILFFPLEEIRKYKGYNFNAVNIYDCFDYNEKVEIYPSFYCNNCNYNCQAFQQSKFIYSPHTLIINLNRGKGIEYNVNIVFEEYLNLRKYILANDSPFYYELIGVICHFGSNDMGGHFIAYCKNSNNCEWYKYNDQNVTKSVFNEVRQVGLPYVLFYNCIKA